VDFYDLQTGLIEDRLHFHFEAMAMDTEDGHSADFSCDLDAAPLTKVYCLVHKHRRFDCNHNHKKVPTE